MQGLPTVTKVAYAKEKIQEWYEHWNGQVYVSFSEGKDSTVLLHLVRQIYPEVPAVFVDTGLEFPEIREFVRSVENVVWLKPKMNFKQVIEKYGYPVVSKETAQKVSEFRNTKSDKLRAIRSNGSRQSVPAKWMFLCGAPFPISAKCCDKLKKDPVRNYERLSGRRAITGELVCESSARFQKWVKAGGCNAFQSQRPQSRPLSIWTEQDIWNCLRAGIPYSKIYDMGYQRTGCVFCMFGLQFDPDRFTRLEQTHPQLHRYCMENLGMREVIDYVQSGGKV
jgi:3'-phosphoadenosine 5'-phosphosulfate sulfotransferase (PAPS reductase)/FAD synthetase